MRLLRPKGQVKEGCQSSLTTAILEENHRIPGHVTCCEVQPDWTKSGIAISYRSEMAAADFKHRSLQPSVLQRTHTIGDGPPDGERAPCTEATGCTSPDRPAELPVFEK